MTRYQLLKVAEFLKQYKKINTIFRVDDTILKVEFGKNEAIFFDLKKGDSFAFLKDDYKAIKYYSAPFDIVLKKRFTNAIIEDIEVEDGNRILKLYTKKSSGYKEQKTILQLEFTGRNTNAIILDSKKIILEALRHIDISTSSREVKVGVTLKAIPPRGFSPKPENIEDIEQFLKDEYKKREEIKLKVEKSKKLQLIQKKIDKFQNLLLKIPSQNSLEQKMQEAYKNADIILSNIHNINGYEQEYRVKDFEGNEVVITLPKEAKSPSHASKILYNQAKKYKQKLLHSHIERENLTSKIEFYKNMQNLISKSKTLDEVNLYLQKNKTEKRQKKVDSNIEVFFYKNYKIEVGKNEKGNITLLKTAKASDTWMHVKDIPSSHVIIHTTKQNLPLEVVEFGAKLCVNLSNLNAGKYLVDYTKRRNVKVKQGASVTYVDYKTIGVVKE